MYNTPLGYIIVVCKDLIMTKHATHSTELNGINRVLGQLDGIKNMITEKRYCIDILTQLKAARSAIKTIEVNVLEKHLTHCLHSAAKSGNEEELAIKIHEIKALLKKYME